jgi:hypothetical protein
MDHGIFKEERLEGEHGRYVWCGVGYSIVGSRCLQSLLLTHSTITYFTPDHPSPTTTDKLRMKHLAMIEKQYFTDEHPANFVTPDKVMAKHNTSSGAVSGGIIGAGGEGANSSNSNGFGGGGGYGGTASLVSTTAELEIHGNGLLLLRFQEDVPVLKQWLQDRYVYVHV